MPHLVLGFSFFLMLIGPATAEWKPVTNRQGIKVYHRDTDGPAIPFMATTIVDRSMGELKAQLLDFPSKPKWAPKLKRVKVHENISSREWIVSEITSMPWPMTHRQFLLHYHLMEKSDGSVVIRGQALKDPSLLKAYVDSKLILAQVDLLVCTLEPQRDGKTQVTFEFDGHLGESVPRWICRIIQRKWPFAFLEALSR